MNKVDKFILQNFLKSFFFKKQSTLYNSSGLK